MIVAMHFAESDVHRGVPCLLLENASSRGHWANLVAASMREAFTVRPRAPWSFKIVVHVRTAEAQ